MADTFAAQFPLLVSREHGRNAIRDALRLHVGRGRRYSVKQLANATGVHDWQINQAMVDGGSPDNRPLPPEALLSICMFLGASFTNEWLHLAHQGAFDLPSDEPDPGAVAADNSDDNAVLVRAAVDGAFDGGERKDLKVVGSRMMTRGAQLVSLGRVAA